MKKLCLLFILILFVSCRTTVKTAKENTAILTESTVEKSAVHYDESNTVDNSIIVVEEKIKKTIDEIENATEEFEARLVVYDTDKPVDEKTGKPPAKSELYITNKKTTGSNIRGIDDGETITTTKLATKQSHESTTNLSTNSLTNTKEKSNLAFTDKIIANKSWILFVLIGLALIAVLLKVLPITKIFAKFKSFISVFVN